MEPSGWIEITFNFYILRQFLAERGDLIKLKKRIFLGTNQWSPGAGGAEIEKVLQVPSQVWDFSNVNLDFNPFQYK